MKNQKLNKSVAIFAAVSLIFLQVAPAGLAAKPVAEDMQGQGVPTLEKPVNHPDQPIQSQPGALVKPAGSKETLSFMEGSPALTAITSSTSGPDVAATQVSKEAFDLSYAVRPASNSGQTPESFSGNVECAPKVGQLDVKGFDRIAPGH